MPLWDLHRLTVFVSVAKAGSLKAAANHLGLPQSAISRHIARFELECKGRLFSRTGRGMALTELGTRILPQVERLLAQADDLSKTISDSAALPFGEVRIASLPSLYLTMIVPLFFQVRTLFPGIKLHVLEGSGGQIDQWLARGDVDIGLPYHYGITDESEVDLLFDLQSFLVGPANDPLMRRESISFRDLDGLPLVLPGAPSAVRLLLDQIARREGIAVNVVFEADSTQLQKTITARGGGYTVLPKHVVRAELQSGQLGAVRIVESSLRRALVLATTSARPASLAVRSVAKLIRQHASSEDVMRAFLG
jgi:DNA-binding transcriptional LysR family regulator